MKHFNFLIIAIMLLFTVIGCPNEETTYSPINRDNTSDNTINVPPSNNDSSNGGKITGLQILIDSTNKGGTIDLKLYPDITDYNATINKAIIIKNGDTSLDANITIAADGVALYDNSFINMNVSASSSVGNGSLKIAGSSLSSLTLGGAGRADEDEQFIVADVKDSAIGKLSMMSNGVTANIADNKTKIDSVSVSGESYIFLEAGGDLTSDISVDNGTLTVFDKTKGMNVMLSFNSLPTKCIYQKNTAYTDEGLEVFATYYGDGITIYDVEGGKPFKSFTKRIVDYKSSIANGTSLTILGQQDVNISFENVSISFPIYVYEGEPPTIESVVEMTDDVQTVYAKGMTLDLSSLRIVAYWSNGEQTELGWTSNPVDGALLDTTGDIIEVAVTYQNGNNEDMTFSLPIRVAEAETCLLTFDANNGTNETRTMKVVVNEGMTLPSNTFTTEKSWMRFVGWNTSADGKGTHYNNRAVFTPSKADTLYAEWKDYRMMDKEFDGKKFSKTSEVVVTDRTVTVEGDEAIWNRFFDPSTDEYYIRKGRFGKAGENVVIKPFAMGQFEVTEELYRAVMEDTEYNESPSKHCFDNVDQSVLADGEIADLRPVDNVNLLTAAYFCNILTEKVMGSEHKVYYFYNVYNAYGQLQSATVVTKPEKLGYRLPTQAEWEFAARGGLASYSNRSTSSWYYAYSGYDTTCDHKVNYLGELYEVTDDKNPSLHHLYSWFNEADKVKLSDYSWFNYNAGYVIGQGNPGYGTHEVGKKRPNSLDLYDMCGNVCEITADFSGDDYSKNEATLGGDYDSLAYNQMLIEKSMGGVTGFRVVRTLE